MDSGDLEQLNALLDNEIDLKEKIKDFVSDFDKRTRRVQGALNKIHSTPSEDVPRLARSVKPMLDECSLSVSAIAGLVPEFEYWRWSGMWSFSLRAAAFGALFVHYLETETLLSLEGVSSVLGIKDEWKHKFTLQAEDYLHGLITMVNEMSRWAVNAVTLGDYERPIRISIFVKSIFAGFSALNLKNDGLRRRFDSLKYDIKKIEEVVYDVSLRRLANSPKKEGVDESPAPR
ncbi:translin [Schizopora paradoxa]|uniref:Translin n=1 Tax=Schizopora paradoxa TaxID=27342 RepID=A0A0H2RZ15_9AGAM|nr:translin [Schizopora paradoxa]